MQNKVYSCSKRIRVLTIYDIIFTRAKFIRFLLTRILHRALLEKAFILTKFKEYI